MERLKKIIINISIAIVTTITVFFICEFFVRFLYKDTTVIFPRYHTDAKYEKFTIRTIRPNSVFWHTSKDGSWKFITNGKGFRNDRDFPYEKQKDVIRFISLGDSHTQGYEVRQNQTFSAIIERYINNKGFKAEVINAGVSGFSTAEELVFLENEGIKYKPDYVIVGFYLNDFEDNIKASLYKLNENNQLVINKYEHIPGVKIQNFIYSLPFVTWMSDNSYFYSLLFNNVWNFFKAQLAKKSSEEVLEYAISTQYQATDYQNKLTCALIKRMYEFCEKNKIKLVLLDIPEMTGKYTIKSSFTPLLFEAVKKYSHTFITSETLLADYIGVIEMHVPNGNNHISEFTHSMLGVAVAKKIISQSNF